MFFISSTDITFIPSIVVPTIVSFLSAKNSTLSYSNLAAFSPHAPAPQIMYFLSIVFSISPLLFSNNLKTTSTS